MCTTGTLRFSRFSFLTTNSHPKGLPNFARQGLMLLGAAISPGDQPSQTSNCTLPCLLSSILIFLPARLRPTTLSRMSDVLPALSRMPDVLPEVAELEEARPVVTASLHMELGSQVWRMGSGQVLKLGAREL